MAGAAGLRPPHDERNDLRWPPAKRRGAGGSHTRSSVASQRNHHQEDPPSTAECHCVRNPNKAQRSCAQRTPNAGHNRMCTPAHRGNAPSPRHPTSLPPHLSLPTQMECSTSPNLYSTLSLPSLYPLPMHTSEMVHFESRPNFHVTAGLWTPAPDAPGKDAQGRRVGILYASGHSCQAWRRYDGAEFWNYQFLLLNLVRTCTTLHAARCTSIRLPALHEYTS